MNRINRRFIALLVVFTSIISFLPVQFNKQIANASTITSEATTIKVYVDGSSTELTATTDSTTDEKIYSTTTYKSSGFDIVLEDVSTTEADLIAEAISSKASVSGIVGQEVEIISINDTSYSTTEGQAILDELGIEISDAEDPDSSTAIVGKKITGLPLGVNKISYKITITTQDIDYTAAVTTTNTDGTTTTTTEAITTASTPVEKSYATQELTIYHGTQYATNKIESMLFKAYIGSSTYFDDDTDEIEDDDINENNTTPFLYSTEAEADEEIPLRYTFDVPDSITTLKYIMTFGDTIPLEGATVYKNGAEAIEGTEYEIDGKTLTGSLESLNNESDLIVIKLNSESSSDIVEKSYSIQIRYNNLDSTEDYSLSEAGITKYQYDDDDDVKAYIGKTFDVTENSAGFQVYTGDIYIDEKADMISIDPTLVRSQSTVAYVVTNNYYDLTSKSTKVQKSVLKNGAQFIDFMASTTSNQLQIDVYEGTDGSKTSSSEMLARYVLDVTLLTTDSFTLDLAFDDNDDNDSTYLTQPGVEANDIDFSTNRRTYDLYSSDPVKVTFALESENDDYTGVRSGKNEYLRVWLADSEDSDNLEEAQASEDNALDSSNVRSTSIDVDLDGAEKMVIQAYYDDFYETSTGETAYVSYAVGDEYIFYLANNIDTTDTGDDSDNALLNLLKVKGATLEDSDENEGFTSDEFDYTTTVEEDDTIAKITATAQDDNVESIIATIESSGSTYDLVSGEASEISLDDDNSTTVTIVVTAQDGITTKTYSIIIENSTESSNSNLEDVILNVGDYTFDSSEDTTKVHVSQSTTSIKVTPITEDSSATVTVEAEDYTSSAITVDLKGSQKKEIEIVVTAEDGESSTTYTLEVYRTDSDEWDDSSSDSDDSSEDDQYYDEYYDCWVDTTKYDEWGTIGSKPAYFDENNRQVKDAWIVTGLKYYYLNSSGYRSSGWKVDDEDGKTYYLDPETGELKKEWMNLNNNWYYLGLNGVMHKGWLNLNNKWYYFTSNGQMLINQSMFIDDGVYKFGQDGAIY
jgi:glucan-binding YG repeat protein